MQVYKKNTYKEVYCNRLYGIDFTSVLTRGSQYRVEASLLKKAHAFGYLLITPSRKRVAAQAPMVTRQLTMTLYTFIAFTLMCMLSTAQAQLSLIIYELFSEFQEVIPLVMEPQSGFYKDPVVVLDFPSLYPSMIIAFNLCYSTCIGKMVPIERRRVENCTYSIHITVRLVMFFKSRNTMLTTYAASNDFVLIWHTY